MAADTSFDLLPEIAADTSSFGFFSSLPFDLRHNIWGFTLEGRFVRVNVINYTTRDCTTDCPNPAALSVCKESRELFLTRYHRFGKSNIYVDNNLDTIFLEHPEGYGERGFVSSDLEWMVLDIKYMAIDATWAIEIAHHKIGLFRQILRHSRLNRLIIVLDQAIEEGNTIRIPETVEEMTEWEVGMANLQFQLGREMTMSGKVASLEGAFLGKKSRNSLFRWSPRYGPYDDMMLWI